MHGTFEANNAMHDCDLMINIGARFYDRITGKIDKYSPTLKRYNTIEVFLPTHVLKILSVNHLNKNLS